MINIHGLEFYENEKVNLDGIYRCHPQSCKEICGIPLRVCSGYQINYDKKNMKYLSTNFYAPGKDVALTPFDNLKYVLASIDGELRIINGKVTLMRADNLFIYSNFTPLKTSGKVKKGQIIGTVNNLNDGFGYGVTLTIYDPNGDIIELSKYIKNIKSIE